MQIPANVIKAGLGLAAAGAAAIALIFVKPHVSKAVDKVNKLWAGRRVAILGRQTVGKTTLLSCLTGQDVAGVRSTVDPNAGGTFEFPTGKKVVRYRVRHDQPGWAPENSYKGWKEDFDDADFVLYLFRADLIVGGDQATVSLVEQDLNQFKSWLPANKSGEVAPKIILIGTWADQNPEFLKDVSKFTSRVRKARPIKLGAVKLNRADLVVGSLAAEDDSARLIASLGGYIQ